MTLKPDSPKRQLGGESVIPALAIAFTLYFFSTIWNSPWTAQVSTFLIGGILLLVCAIFFVQAGLVLRSGQGNLGFGNLITREDISSGRVGLFATTVGYCILIDHLGFTLTTFLFLSSSMFILSRGRNAAFISLISAAMALAGWAVFIWAFDTRFPRGWFENMMKAVLSNG